MMRRAKVGCAFVLAAFLALGGLGIGKAQAAGRIETDRECSLTVSVDIGSMDGENDAYLADLNEMEIPVAVYKVADVDITGQKLTTTAPFTELEIDGERADWKAAQWQELAGQAMELLEKALEGKNEEEQQSYRAGETTVVKEEGSAQAAWGQISGLETGLYLVVPEDTYNPDYSVQYTFAPYLAALPSSEYTLTGTGSDEWVYDTTVGLKLDAVPLYGKLNITKHLRDFNATLGRTTFVFSIVGTDKNQVIKYEEVESLSFTEPGSQTITLEKIPAGLDITVTEIYSGASYQVEGGAEKVTLICSEEGVSIGGQSEASVEFTNRYGGGNRGGYGVTNHFDSDGQGGWIWNNPTTPADE